LKEQETVTDTDPAYPNGPFITAGAWLVMTLARVALVGWRIRWWLTGP
jgi:hypothetical protein